MPHELRTLRRAIKSKHETEPNTQVKRKMWGPSKSSAAFWENLKGICEFKEKISLVGYTHTQGHFTLVQRVQKLSAGKRCINLI